jgi:hypothetical protein
LSYFRFYPPFACRLHFSKGVSFNERGLLKPFPPFSKTNDSCPPLQTAIAVMQAMEGAVGRRGFEPLKSKDSGFTVRPIWPLWNLPDMIPDFKFTMYNL